IEKARLGALLASADVLVQPGAADDFNDYRLPSKIPEFMCVGRPVIMPRANLAREMTDGYHALLLQSGDPNEIADQCQRVFADSELARRLGEGALEFARTHFDVVANTDWLLAFYERVRATAAPIFSDPLPPPSEVALLVAGDLGLRLRATDESIRAARVENVRLRALESLLQSEAQAARHETELLRAQLNETSQANTRLMRFADAADKVHRMTNSFSWQITSPLRSFRRKLIDPKKRAGNVVTTRVPPLDPLLKFGVDEPEDWKQISPTGTVRGWVVAANGTQIVGVRARTADRVFDAVYGLMRPDIAAANPQQPYTLHSGFSLEYRLLPETSQVIVFEALTADGRWRCFASPTAVFSRNIPEHERRDYATWVRRFDGPTLDQTVTRRARIEALKPEQRLLLSVIMPVYDTPDAWLVKAIESVRAQIYPHWELCIANDASSAPHVRRILDDYARRDARIRITHRETNGHISAASNSALGLVTGEFVALLDHDDEFAPHALSEVLFALIEKPTLEYLYSDEDKIDELGRRSDPYFKPDWNPDLLLGQNYTCHLSVYRASLLRELGGFREGFEGSQDWDLALRATAKLPSDKIHHIPHVLYHWRAIPGSTALLIEGKQDYPFIAARKALQEHLQRTGTSAELVPVEGRHWRLKRAMPDTAPKVSIVIPTKNATELLRLCLTTLLAKTTYPSFELIVVNNRSDDAVALAYLEELRRSDVTVLDYDATFNFSALNNFAVRHAQGDVIAFLNNDIEVLTPDWLQEMVSQAIRPEIGAVGAMLYYPDDTIQHAGAILGLTGIAGKEGVAGHAFKGFRRGVDGQRNRLRLVQNYSALTAACLVIRRTVFEQVGGFNEGDLPVAFNDIDFCLRIRKAGYRNLWTPFAEFYHHESASRGLEDTPEKVKRFQGEVTYMRRTWSRLLDADPAYNPNLSLQHEDFSLAFPPR
ncbi:MAG: glycosyltransferase, partial [Opitutus sp.]